MNPEVSFLSLSDRARVRAINELGLFTAYLFARNLHGGLLYRLAHKTVNLLATEGLRRRYRADRLRRGVPELSVDPAFDR